METAESQPPKLVGWGILGTGNIARAFANGLAASKTGKLVAVGSRQADSAEAFGAKYNVPKSHCYASYTALLSDPQVEAVYISTPHPQHAEWAMAAARAGKHILCEKPLTMNLREAEQVIEAARQHQVFLMEAFMYRCHPQIARLLELIKQGTIGEVRLIQASFSFDGGNNQDSRLLNKKLGGGGILDVGCYPVSMVRMIAGVAGGHDSFADPLTVEGAAHIGNQSGVDEYATALLRFPNDILAQLVCGVRLNGENEVRIFGTKGQLVIPDPWTAQARKAGSSRIIVYRQGNSQHNWERWLWRQKWWREIMGRKVERVKTSVGTYTLEADVVAQQINNHLQQATFPSLTWDDTLGNIRTLDRWRAAVGLRYPADDNLNNSTAASKEANKE